MFGIVRFWGVSKLMDSHLAYEGTTDKYIRLNTLITTLNTDWW